MELGRKSDAISSLEEVLKTNRRGMDVFALLLDLQRDLGRETDVRVTAKDAMLLGLERLADIVRFSKTKRMLRRDSADPQIPETKIVDSQDHRMIEGLAAQGWRDVTDEICRADVRKLLTAIDGLSECLVDPLGNVPCSRPSSTGPATKEAAQRGACDQSHR